MKRPVVLPNQHYLDDPREMGLPSGMYIGKVFWSHMQMTISIIVENQGNDALRHVETRGLIFRPGAKPWIPLHWRQAMAEYAQQWPMSGEWQAYYSEFVPMSLRRAHLLGDLRIWEKDMRAHWNKEYDGTDKELETMITRTRKAWIGLKTSNSGVVDTNTTGETS